MIDNFEKRLTHRYASGVAKLTDYGFDSVKKQTFDELVCNLEDKIIPIPKVLSLEELLDAAYTQDHPAFFLEPNKIDLSREYPVWFEGWVGPAEPSEEEIELYRFGVPNPIYAKLKNYCKTWRCWDKEPSEKQKAQTPWFEGEKDETEN